MWKLCTTVFLGFVAAATTSHAATLFIDFETIPQTGDQPESVAFTDGDLTATLTRRRASISVDNIAVTAGNRELNKFGSKSLSSFNDMSALTDYVLTFSRPVRSVKLSAGDFGQDTPDVAYLTAHERTLGLGDVIDIDREEIDTRSSSNPFNSTVLRVKDNDLFSSVTFEGGTPSFPHSLYYDNIFVEYPDEPGQSEVESSQRTIIGGFERAFSLGDEGGFIEDRAARKRAAEDCALDPNCRDDFQTDWREANLDVAREAAVITESIAPLTLQTSPVPDSRLDLLVNLDFWVNEAIAGLGLVNGLFGRDDYELEATEVEGEQSDFTINPDFSFFDLMIRATIDTDVLVSAFGVSQVSTEGALRSGNLGFGIFGVEDFGFDVASGESFIDLSYRGIESPNFQSSAISPVPLPASWISMLAAVGFFGWFTRRQNRSLS